MAPLLQWNCNGGLHHYHEIHLLISLPIVLPEKRLKQTDTLSETIFPRSMWISWVMYEHVVVWLCFLKYSTFNEHVEMNTELQAVAICVFLLVRVVSACAFTVSASWNPYQQWKCCYSAGPVTFRGIGDIDTHNVAWGSVGTDAIRRQIDLLSNLDISSF